MICIALVEDNAQERTRIGALVRKTADTLGEFVWGDFSAPNLSKYLLAETKKDGKILVCDTAEKIKEKAGTENFEQAFIRIAKGVAQ